MILSFQTDRYGQTYLKEQSDQGLHCSPFSLHILEALLYGKTTFFKFYDNYSNIFWCLNFQNFTVKTTLNLTLDFGRSVLASMSNVMGAGRS